MSTLGHGQKYCTVCGKVLDARAELCPGCGVRQLVPAILPPMGMTRVNNRDKTTAGVFALLLGGLGAHKFYLGQAGLGVVYLLFCWTFVPSIVAFFEGITLLTMSNESFDEKYNY